MAMTCVHLSQHTTFLPYSQSDSVPLLLRWRLRRPRARAPSHLVNRQAAARLVAHEVEFVWRVM